MNESKNDIRSELKKEWMQLETSISHCAIN